MTTNDVKSIDGPRLEAASGKAKSLIIFLHGYGADGNDLIGLGRYWAPVLPDTAFVSPHAPDPCDGAPMGRQWFPLANADPHLLRGGVMSAAPTLQAFIDGELERYGFDEGRVMLVGFSQGTMMSLYAGLRRQTPLAGIIGYSGLLPDPEHLGGEIVTKPPVLLVHGDRDPLIPSIAMHAAAKVLKDVGVSVEAHLRPDLEHGIDEEGLRLGATFARGELPA